MSADQPNHAAQIFEQYRGLLFGIAYRMLSSATDAEDVVQDAFVRWLQAEQDAIQLPKAYLSTVVVRLCIDQLRQAKVRREHYIGPWLPEPIETDQRKDLVETAILAESLSFAFLVLLENLSPLERAVLLLREVFDYDYAEIAEVVGKSATNCRQVLHRAHQRLGQRQPRFSVSRQQQEDLTHQFLRATTAGDLQGLTALLADEIVFTGDGGGKGQTGRRPVQGADKVARGALGGLRSLVGSLEPRIMEVNGQPAIVGYREGQPFGVLLLDVDDGLISRIYVVVNPDKLAWLARAA
jgi:RNA polymerase sigma-70 factor (ECF subfamily)